MVIEEQAGRPGYNMAAINTMMRNYGMILSSLLIAIPEHDKLFAIHPKTWQAQFYHGKQYDGLDSKEKSILQVNELFGISIPDHNITDALLMAIYGIILIKGQLLSTYSFNYIKQKEQVIELMK